jgi:tRNA U55 pseudouridine synthase TruB
MILVIGKECRNAQKYSKLDKEYLATIRLGHVSSTGDPEGVITPFVDAASTVQLPEETQKFKDSKFLMAESQVSSESVPLRGVSARPWRSADGSKPVPASPGEAPTPSATAPSRQVVEAALKQFTGQIEQTPPQFSAIKVGGQRAYKLARQGEKFEIPKRTVKVYELELVDYDYPSLKVRAKVSSGTYIRSLAEDIGQALGTGAYCQELRRTKVADWSVDEAQSLGDLGIDN